MIKDIICNSDCEYSEAGFCEKQKDVLMLWTSKDNSDFDVPYVSCDDYVPRKEALNEDITK